MGPEAALLCDGDGMTSAPWAAIAWMAIEKRPAPRPIWTNDGRVTSMTLMFLDRGRRDAVTVRCRERAWRHAKAPGLGCSGTSTR